MDNEKTINYCPKCGAKIDSRYEFCTLCNYKIQHLPIHDNCIDIEISPILEARGTTGQLFLLPDRIRISRKGFSAFILHGLKGDKEIYLSQISSIQFKKCDFITAGYIQFAFLGGQENKSGLFDAVKDENTIMFNNKQQDQFEIIKQEIDKRISKSKNSVSISNKISESDEIEKLANLKEKGILSNEEFQFKKKQILGIP